jgi:hypothetical protein
MTPLLSAVATGRGLRVLLIAAGLAAPWISHAAAADANFTGHYELTEAKASRTFTLDVNQIRSRADVTFSAAMADGSGAAPDGEGKGRVEDGVLSFNFKDSFNNEGTCTLASMHDGYHLSITVIKVVDSGPFHFYGNILLKKTSAKPQ